MKQIARIHSDFSSKFGIPRQSGLAASLKAKIVFEPEYRHPDAVRGLEEYTYIWLIWEFSETTRDSWSSTVRPPRLGGNTRMGVFATRSPYRPNPIGLSCVRLEEIRRHPQWGPVLCVSGADLMDGTPLYDIKPYLPTADCHPEASGGFLRSGRPAPCWRWRSPNDGTPFSLTDVCRLCRRCWPWIPGRRISMTRIGFTASLSRAAKFVLQCGMGSDRLRC